MIVFGNKVSGEDAVKGLMFVKEPLWDNMHNPPKQLILETAEDIIINIENIYSQSVASFAMPPGNVSFLENHERAEIEKLYLTILNLTSK